MPPLSWWWHGSLVDCAGAQYILQVPLQHSKKRGQSHGCSAHQVKTQRKTKVAKSLVAMAGHLNKGKQDWPMPTDPAPCGLKSHFGKNQTTATTSAGQTPILWVSQDCIAGTNSSSLTPRRTTLRALHDLERVLIASPHKHPYQPLCPCLLHNNNKKKITNGFVQGASLREPIRQRALPRLESTWTGHFQSSFMVIN